MALRDKLRRLGAAGAVRGSYRPSTEARPSNSGDGVEVIRARYALSHRRGYDALGESLKAVSDDGEGIDPAETVWLDTETTGLAGGTGTYVFLVGLASLEGEALIVEQFLLRRLSAEVRLLSILQERLAHAKRLVTFNGQRFDWPILEARFILARLRPSEIELHTDLIHPARRLWHRVLGTHRLGALETSILGTSRAGDIPGWEIPMVYVQYLRTSERAALDPVLEHNRADLLALVSLHGRVVRVLHDPAGTSGPIDWEGAGVLLMYRGNHGRAVQCFERALHTRMEPRDRWRTLRRCVSAYRALGDVPRGAALWEEAARSWSGTDRYRAQVLFEVARVREQAGDRVGAREAAEESLRVALASLHGVTPCLPTFMERLNRKVTRLTRPLA